MEEFIFKPYNRGYLHVRGNGRVIYYTPEQMKVIHECCHELERREGKDGG